MTFDQLLMTFAITLLVLAILGLLLMVRAHWDHEQRIRKLETLLPKRHTHRNAMTLENYIAMILAAQVRHGEMGRLLDTLRELLANERADPNFRPFEE